MHQKWARDPAAYYGHGFKPELKLPSGKRVDAINFGTLHIKELEPNNPRQLREGRKQVTDYLAELEANYPDPAGRPWTGEVVTHD